MRESPTRSKPKCNSSILSAPDGHLWWSFGLFFLTSLWTAPALSHELGESDRAMAVALGLGLMASLLFSGVLLFLIRRRKQAESALQAVHEQLQYREALFASLFEQSSFLAGVLDEQTRLVEINRFALDVINQPAEAVLGKLFEDTAWWQDKDKPALRHCIAKAQAGERASFEAVHVGHDGQMINVLVSVVPVQTAERRYLSVFGVDVSSQVLTTHELGEAIEFLTESEAVAGVGHWVIDLDSGKLEWSAQTYRLFGLPEGTAVTLNTGAFTSCVHPDDREALTDAWQAALASGGIYEIEHRILVEGEVRWIRERADLSRAQGGRVLGTALDITARKRTELELRRSQEILQSAIDTIGEAFVIYDENDCLLLCNERYREVYPSVSDLMRPGVSFEEIVRTWVARGAPDLKEGETADDWVTRRMALHRNGQMMIQHTDNDRWVRIIERTTPAGHIVGFRVDITDLVRATQAAEAANIAKSRFLATMSHEIRTPLNGILGMAQLMLIDDDSSIERFRDNARTILQSGQQLLSLLNDVLDLSKVESNALTLEDGVIDPPGILQESRGLFVSLANDKGLGLFVDWQGPAGETYRGDAYRMAQALNNLMNNAIKFTSKGSVNVVARVLSRQDNLVNIEFSVADTGPGIEPRRLHELFKPFSQLDSSTTRQHGGTGLGLAIVASLAQAMGGSAGVESDLGKGSRFWFTVTLEKNTDPLAVNADSDRSRTVRRAVDMATLRGRILVVEHNQVNCRVIQAMLRRLGLDSVLAMNGADGVERYKAEADKFDLVMMDMEMPVMDGCMATHVLRDWERDEGIPRVPVVALTANAFAEDRVRCLDAGMDDYLSKPVKADQLVAVLSQWLSDNSIAAESKASVLTNPMSQPDWDALTAQLDTLLPLLSQGRFDAIKQFKLVEALVKHTSLDEEVDEVAADLQAFRFADAIDRLGRLKASRAKGSV